MQISSDVQSLAVKLQGDEHGAMQENSGLLILVGKTESADALHIRDWKMQGKPREFAFLQNRFPLSD